MTLYFPPTIKLTQKGKTITIRVTVAGVQEEHNGNIRLRLGFAICSHKDQFVKKVGRAKAEGRALSDTQSTITDLGPIGSRSNPAILGIFLASAIDHINSLGFTVEPKAKNVKELGV